MSDGWNGGMFDTKTGAGKKAVGDGKEEMTTLEKV